MANTTADKLDRLMGTKDAIKTAIINKGQEVGANDTFRSYAEKINAIETGVDTSDATATANDIVASKTAYAKGSKLTGNINRYGSFCNGRDLEGITVIPNFKMGTVSDYVLGVGFFTRMLAGSIYDEEVQLNVSHSKLVNAIGLTANKIKKDEIVLGVTGTYDGGVAEALSQSY